MRFSNVETIEIAGKTCWIVAPEGADTTEPITVLYMGTSGFPEEWEGIAPKLTQGEGHPFVLAAFDSEDWNHDFSPWTAPPLGKNAEPFAGAANETLRWLLDQFVLAVEARWTAKRRGIVGYSLSGLFSLWSMTQTEQFALCASCSGSLWFDGFVPYLKEQVMPVGSSVYMSLGDKEGKARNPRMASVEAESKAAAEWLLQNENVVHSTFVLNPGGHFTDLPARIAAAIDWLIGQP